MNEDCDKLQSMLEQATGAGDASAEDLDPQAVRLHETWLAFGQLLEAAQPATDISRRPLNIFPRPLGEGRGVRAVLVSTRPHRWRLTAAAALAASLLIAVATVWMLSGANPQGQVGTDTQQLASTKQQVTAPAPASVIKWDDALDEQIAQLGQQMGSAQTDQLGTVDEFSAVQSRMKQFRQEVTADSL